MKLILSLLACSFIAACSSTPKKEAASTSAAAAGPTVVVDEKGEIENANVTLSLNHFDQSLAMYRKFQKDHPNSRFFMSARLGEAQSLEGLEKWNEAAEIYRSVYDSSVQMQPEIAALAQYRLSFCYEATGEDIKAVASLLDSLKKKDDLPPEVGAAEIPARLAMLYGKVQNVSESNKYMELAQKGIQDLQTKKTIPPVTLAKAYYEMGSVTMSQITVDTFPQAALGLKTVQKYLFRSVNLQVTPWSAMAGEKLQKNYRDLWNTLVAMPGIEGADAESLARNRRNEQILLGSEFVDLIQNAESFKPLDANKMTIQQTEFFAYISDLKKQTQDLIYQPEPTMGLTEESQKLNDVKRPGQIKDATPLPAMTPAPSPTPTPTPVAAPTPSSQDPNL